MDTLAAQAALLDLLLQHPQGLSEYQLLKQLPEDVANPPTDFTDSLSLFQSHFLLFHLLYRLREQLLGEQRGDLQISVFNIQWRPYSPHPAGLQHDDPLRDYYLDLRHLHNTDERDVDEMLNQFWLRFAAANDKTLALQLFSLKEPVEFQQIKFRYRQLVSLHHPDRGGDKEKLQQINDAMTTLKRYYQR
ncbi:MAG: molecular chaperone DnaJ [Gammaproteobacteria bacterium]|nr:molecular chaperone DnaJ [Gammaproteobacteria bacterium]